MGYKHGDILLVIPTFDIYKFFVCQAGGYGGTYLSDEYHPQKCYVVLCD